MLSDRGGKKAQCWRGRTSKTECLAKPRASSWVDLTFSCLCSVMQNFYMLGRTFRFKVYLFFWERESTSRGGGQRERKRERMPRRLCTVSTKPDAGVEITHCEIMTWAKTKSRTLSHPGGPGKNSVQNLYDFHTLLISFSHLPILPE